MIGGEMAAEAALAGPRVAAGGEGWDLGWVTDWLYGSAALPPAPLPPRAPVPAYRHLAPVHAEASIAAQPVELTTPARRRARPRPGARQLALL